MLPWQNNWNGRRASAENFVNEFISSYCGMQKSSWADCAASRPAVYRAVNISWFLLGKRPWVGRAGVVWSRYPVLQPQTSFVGAELVGCLLCPVR